MATVRYNVCDRCGKEIKSHPKLAIIRQFRRYKIAWIVTGMTLNSEAELCGNCTKEFERFLEGVKPNG